MNGMMVNSTKPPKRNAVRAALDTLYLVSGVVAGIFLAGIALTIVAQIVGRFVGLAVDATELAGFLMAASTFSGLAYTLKSGTHVRVTLALLGLRQPVRRIVEVVALLVGVTASSYFTYFAMHFVIQSYQFNDISPGLLAIPFWIPQLSMAIGAALLTLAFVDELAIVLTGGTPGYDSQEGVLDQLQSDSENAPGHSRRVAQHAETTYERT